MGGICVALGLVSFFGVISYFGVPSEIVVGIVLGVSIVVGLGFLFLVMVIFIEVGERRAAQVPAHVRAASPLAPRTLRWMRGLLPGGEGTAWLAEVASSLAETPDKRVRRRLVRSYRRGVPRLVWTSWAEYLSASRRRELS